MDQVHFPESRKWISSTPVRLGDHLSGSFSSRLRADRDKAATQSGFAVTRVRGDLRDKEAATRILMGVSLDNLPTAVFTEVSDVADLAGLDMDGVMPPTAIVSSTLGAKFRPTGVPDEGARTLMSLELQQQYLRDSSKEAKARRTRQSKYINSSWFESAPPRPEKVNPALLDSEVVITVRIYRHFKAPIAGAFSVINQLKCSQEIFVLGRNKLSDLRDKIRCNADLTIPGEVSKDPSGETKRSQAKTAGEIYRSGFFYVEGCFYNDMRWPECIDYSEVIRQWASSAPNRKLGPFTVAKMEDTLFKDLVVRPGYPYVYVHQGNHEHIFTVSDARLLGVDDLQHPSKYPFERSLGVRHSKYCMVCSVNIAKWVTKDNERVPEDPYFFCESCFKSYNYDENGYKLGKFLAYPFVDVNVI